MDGFREILGHFLVIQHFFHPNDTVELSKLIAALRKLGDEAKTLFLVEAQRTGVVRGDDSIGFAITLLLQQSFQCSVELSADALALGLGRKIDGTGTDPTG